MTDEGNSSAVIVSILTGYNSETIVTIQAYMVVLCATWRRAQDAYFLLSEMVQRNPGVKPLIMFGASGDRNIEVRTSDIETGDITYLSKLSVHVCPRQQTV